MFQTIFRKLSSRLEYICLWCLFLLSGIRNVSNHFLRLFYPSKVIIEKVRLYTTAIVREYNIPQCLQLDVKSPLIVGVPESDRCN